MFHHFVSIQHCEQIMPKFKGNSWKYKNVWDFFGNISRNYRNVLQFHHIWYLTSIPCVIYENIFITQLDILLHLGNIILTAKFEKNKTILSKIGKFSVFSDF